MFSMRMVLDGIRELALCCTGSPDSRIRQLAALRKLDAHLLRDIGLTPDEAKRSISAWVASRENAPRATARLDLRRTAANR